MFLHDAFNFGVVQRIQKLISHQILDIYPHISFINKGLSIVQKLWVLFDTLKVIWFNIHSN